MTVPQYATGIPCLFNSGRAWVTLSITLAGSVHPAGDVGVPSKLLQPFRVTIASLLCVQSNPCRISVTTIVCRTAVNPLDHGRLFLSQGRRGCISRQVARSEVNNTGAHTP